MVSREEEKTTEISLLKAVIFIEFVNNESHDRIKYSKSYYCVLGIFIYCYIILMSVKVF